MDIFSPERWSDIAEAAKSEGATDWQVRKWRTRRRIPGSWHLPILRACIRRGVSLSGDELLSTINRSAA